MLKSKTQAQKQFERETRIKEAEEIRLEQKRVKDLELQNKHKNAQQKILETQVLSKKAKRKQKQESEQDVGNEINKAELLHKDLSVTENYQESAPFISTDNKLKKLMKVTNEKALTESIYALDHLPDEKHAARTVKNHSTFCKGLIPLLTKLEKMLPECTFIPGEISQTQSGAALQFELRFQRMMDKNSYKFVARRGHTAQDVIICVSDSSVYTEAFLLESIKEAMESKNNKVEEATLDVEEIALSAHNRSIAEYRQNMWRDKHKENHGILKEQEKEIKQEKQINERNRILATKNISEQERQRCAKRDLDIVSGKNRGKYAMKK